MMPKTPMVDVVPQTAVSAGGTSRKRYQVQWRMVVHDEGIRERLPGEGSPYHLAALLFDDREEANEAATRLEALLTSGKVDPEDGRAVAAIVESW